MFNKFDITTACKCRKSRFGILGAKTDAFASFWASSQSAVTALQPLRHACCGTVSNKKRRDEVSEQMLENQILQTRPETQLWKETTGRA